MASSFEKTGSPPKRNFLDLTRRENIDPDPSNAMLQLQMDLIINNSEWREKYTKLEKDLNEYKLQLKQREEALKEKDMIMKTLHEVLSCEAESSVIYLVQAMVNSVCAEEDAKTMKRVEAFDEEQSKKRIKHQ